MRVSMFKTGYPELVNVYVVRTVAFFTVLLALAFLFTQSVWILAYMLYEFAIRFLYGPRFSPLARLSLWIVTLTDLGWQMSSGRPKRFAQAIGTLFTITGISLVLTGATQASLITLGILAVFATLEAVIGFCAACFMFGFMIRWGWVSDDSCHECNNLTFMGSDI